MKKSFLSTLWLSSAVEIDIFHMLERIIYSEIGEAFEYLSWMLDVRCMDEVYIRGLFTIFIDTSELMHLGISFQLCLIHSPSF